MASKAHYRSKNISAGGWREKKYGRISGVQLERVLGIFRDLSNEFGQWTSALQNEREWSAALEKLVAVPNWVNFYQDSLLDLIAKIIAISGLSDQLIAAASSGDPIESMLDLAEKLPDSAPDHPASVPLAFAIVGNLQAIARFSRSINDMLVACRERGDVQALFDALSIDSCILTMPFFQAGLRLGQLSGEASFSMAVSKALEGPHASREEYAELRWIEYLLRDQGAFEVCTREEIYELCVVHLAVYDPSGLKKDPKAALFARFRAWQKEAGIQKPRFGFSAKGQ